MYMLFCNPTLLVIDCDDIQAFIDGNSNQLPQARPAHPHRYRTALILVALVNSSSLRSYSTLISELYFILADDALKSNDTK